MAAQGKHIYEGGGGTPWARELRWAQQLQRSAARHSDAAVWFCSAYHPHVGKKFCSCFRSLFSGSYKRETPPRPVCPGPPCS